MKYRNGDYGFTLHYRYIPGALGDHSSLDHGAVMVEGFWQRKTRDRRLAQLAADPRIQWASVIKSGNGPTRTDEAASLYDCAV